MRLVLCACGVYLADPDNADYVKDGKPMCAAATCQKVREHGRAARDVPIGTSWAFPSHRTLAEADAVPTHINSKGVYDVVA